MACSKPGLDGSDEYFRRTLLGDSNKVNKLYCEPCIKKGSKVDAVKHCQDCAENLCGHCFKRHARIKAFRNHVTNDVNTMDPVTTDPKTDQQISRRAYAKKSSTGSNKKLTAKLVSSMEICSSSDEKLAFIRDLTIVRSHYCVVTDNDNKAVKVADARQMCVVSEIHISDADRLYAITTVNDKVAVSVEIKDVYKLMFFYVSKSGIISHTDRCLYMETYYLGIIHHNDRLYASHYHGIHIISMSGQIIKTIDNDAFRFLQGIALSNDHNTIYVCSYKNDTVFSVDLEGNIKAAYKDKDLKKPDGVTVDIEGYVYVCSSGTKCVHLLTAGLNKVQAIISSVLCNRCTFNRAENRLYVEFYEEIKMYDMNYIQDNR